MLIIKILYHLLCNITLVYGLYFVICGVIGLLKKYKRTEPVTNKRNRFAILVAARNEGKTLGGLLTSLQMLKYPRDCYSVYVIPNNCTDNTKEVAMENGAHVIDCTVQTKTKAEVLRFAFEKLQSRTDIDAYIIFDADNVVDENYLTHMNRSFNAGNMVAQGFRDAKNPGDNWISGSYSIYYLFQNVFFNRARRNMHISAAINGTGFMVRKDLIDKEGFDTKTLTEDIEFSELCALKDIKIDFVEEAVTYDEHPADFKSSWKQRKRWTAGNLSCMKLYTVKLFRHFLKTGHLPALDMVMFNLAPIMAIMGYVCILLTIPFGTMDAELYNGVTGFLVKAFFGMVASYFLWIITEIIVLKLKKKRIKSVISGLLMFFFFMLTWLPINLLCLIRKHTAWEEIRHSRQITIAEIKQRY